jgi:hypothetical protein
VIASDGVWDAFEKMLRVNKMMRHWHTDVRTLCWCPLLGVLKDRGLCAGLSACGCRCYERTQQLQN